MSAPFGEPVPFKVQDRYIEDIPPNFWGVAVREISEFAYQEIVELAGSQPAQTTKSVVRKILDLPPIDELEISTNLARDVLITPKPRATNSTSTSSVSRRSEYSKAIGDQGEKIVLRHLRESLPTKAAATVRWVADEGETPGWDIGIAKTA